MMVEVNVEGFTGMQVGAAMRCVEMVVVEI